MPFAFIISALVLASFGYLVVSSGFDVLRHDARVTRLHHGRTCYCGACDYCEHLFD